MSERVNEVREETLRFLYARSALPHALSAVRAGLRRAGLDVTEAQAKEALDYLTGKGWAVAADGPFGGGEAAKVWRVTSAGKDVLESLS